MGGLVIVSRDDRGCGARRVGGGVAGGVVARPGVGGGVDQGVPAGSGGSGGGHHRHPGAAAPVVAVAAGGVLRAGVVAVPGSELRYGRVMVKLVEALYHRRRGQQLLDGVLDPEGWVDAGEGRRWRPPNISSLSRARTRLGADPLHMLFEQVAGPVGAPDAAGVFCCGLRVVSMDGSSTDVPDTKENDEYFGRPSNATRAGAFPQVRWVVAAESGTGALIGAAIGAYTVGEQTLARDLLGAFGPGMLVLADRNFL